MGLSQPFEKRACVGEGDRSVAALEKLNADRVLKLADRLADGRLTDIQLARRQRERPVPRRGLEGREMAQRADVLQQLLHKLKLSIDPDYSSVTTGRARASLLALGRRE